MIRDLINLTTLAGEIVLDPFAGSGSCAMAGIKANRVIISCEKEKHHYDYLVDNVKQSYEEQFDRVKFI